MTKRDVVKTALAWKRPPYVPWSFGFTQEALEKLYAYYGTKDLSPLLANHILWAKWDHEMKDVGEGCYQDIFGVVWDRSVDKDIGVVRGSALPEPTLKGYTFPDPLDPFYFEGTHAEISRHPDLFRVFPIGFSLYERAWTLRGMENLMMDFVEHPDFVHELLNAIADWNIAHITEGMKYDVDAVHFGDDWGQQRGLQMGPNLWRKFILPPLRRMYSAVKKRGLLVSIHSCGDVDELFDDLVAIGLNCFNPFQPEVMDVEALMRRYKGVLSFQGGLSTQKTLPYGTAADVRRATQHLLKLGSDGGYIFAPAHCVEGDVPVENMVAFIEEVHRQPGFTKK